MFKGRSLPVVFYTEMSGALECEIENGPTVGSPPGLSSERCFPRGGHTPLGKSYSSLIELFESIIVGFGIFNLYLIGFLLWYGAEGCAAM